MRVLLCIFICLFSCDQALALNTADRKHAQNAFLFSDKRDWNNATQHARRAQDRLLLKTVEWQYFRDKNSGAAFSEITRFIRENPTWPDIDILKQRAEEALSSGVFNDQEARQWFSKTPPATGIGKLRLAEILERAGAGESTIRQLAKEGWKDADLDPSLELAFKDRFGKFISVDDHTARIDRLLWEDKTAPAVRMLSLIPSNRRALYEARIALIKDARNAAALTDRIPSALQKDVGFIFDRMRWRDRHDLDDGVLELLKSAPSKVPYPKRWWKYREKAIRNALDKKNYKLAYALTDNHGQLEGAELLEALWLRGWIGLEYLKGAKAAYENFYKLYHEANFPVSKARGAYWAGRAAEINGNTNIARSWFKQASGYPTTFYGQLALAKLGTPLTLPKEHEPTKEQMSQFRKNELPRVVILLTEAHQNELAHLFTLHMVEQAKTALEARLVTELSDETHQTEDGVKAAKRASQKHNITLIAHGYPKRNVPGSLPLEAPLANAIIRQESEFDRRALSPSGAMGLMQLLPSTAKEVARKSGVGYSKDRLFEPDYNIRLGSTYLGKLVSGFDGSYVYAIAGYNAGPSRVRGWIEKNGRPQDLNGIINWIERIPYSETRNYVQRVTENLQVYRYLMGHEHVPIDRDLLR